MPRFLLAFILCAAWFILPGHYAEAQVNKTITSIEEAYQNRTIDQPTKILFQLYAGIEPGRVPAAYRKNSTNDVPIKCATPYLREYHQKRSTFPEAVISEIERMTGMQKLKQETYNSTSGRFVIYYETTGTEAVPSMDANANGTPDYVEWTAAAADSSWRHEVQTLGYVNPVSGSTAPYPIYIEDLGANGFYGYTSVGDDRGYPNSTYIVINSQLDQPAFTDNDHPNPTEGAVNVTVAHELKHAIQYTNSAWYINEPNSPHAVSWSEMDATLMEEVVYDNVNDYYNYIAGSSSIFNDANHMVPASYGGVTWPIFHDEYFGSDFWPDVWNRIRQRYLDEQNNTNPDYITMPEAVSLTLMEQYTSSFANTFARSHLWHFASGTALSAPEYGFDERTSYPSPAINARLAGRDSITVPNSIPPLSANYIELDATAAIPGSVRILLDDTDSYTTVGMLGYFKGGHTEEQIFQAAKEGILTGNTGWKWEDLTRVGIVITNTSSSMSTAYTLKIDSNIPEEIVIDQNYPNPFTDQTTIPISLPENAQLQIKIFDTTGRLVETLLDEQREAGYNPVPFNGTNLASGVYFVQIRIGNKVFVKKMTLIK